MGQASRRLDSPRLPRTRDRRISSVSGSLSAQLGVGLDAIACFLASWLGFWEILPQFPPLTERSRLNMPMPGLYYFGLAINYSQLTNPQTIYILYTSVCSITIAGRSLPSSVCRDRMSSVELIFLPATTIYGNSCLKTNIPTNPRE